jgi:hypothetical protein
LAEKRVNAANRVAQFLERHLKVAFIATPEVETNLKRYEPTCGPVLNARPSSFKKTFGTPAATIPSSFINED